MAASFRVLKSLENQAADRCVDIFERADGTFGFEECRRDHEDAGQWFPLDKYSRLIFDSQAGALAGAKASVPWLVLEKFPGK
jgi:hypothetical protein